MANNFCTHLKDLMDSQKPALVQEIKRNKWYLSEKARHDVGWEAAEQDFIHNYLATWAAGFKAAYCTLLCSDRDNCSVKGNRQ